MRGGSTRGVRTRGPGVGCTRGAGAGSGRDAGSTRGAGVGATGSARGGVIRGAGFGHGVGRLCHDEPNIVHVGRPGEGIVLRPGMFFTVEPMINLGRPHVKVLSDGWTAVTRDRSLSAQFEHTVAVTEDGVEIFTLSPQGLDRPGPSPAPRA